MRLLAGSKLYLCLYCICICEIVCILVSFQFVFVCSWRITEIRYKLFISRSFYTEPVVNIICICIRVCICVCVAIIVCLHREGKLLLSRSLTEPVVAIKAYAAPVLH